MISPLTLSKKFVTVCILSVSVYSNTSWADANSSTEVYRFGVVPQQSASQLATLWVPFIKKIRELSGVNIKFETATNIPIFEKRVGKKHYDFVYMNPYHYVVAHDLVGYQALVREKNKKIKGILVVKKNGGIRSVHDLEKKRLAFPSIAAFAATIIPSNSLKKKQISIKANYVASHDSVYKTVSMGLYDAGGGIRRTYNALDKVIRDQLEIIWESRGHTPHAFAVKPGISPDVINKIQQAMLALSNDPEGREILTQLRFNPLIKAHDSDWNDIREMKIDDPTNISPN